MRQPRFVFVLAFLSASAAVNAQVLNIQADRVPIAEISIPWHFQTGDNPAFAAADFDDSAWPLIRPDKGWSEQGYAEYTGFAWYRVRVIPMAKPRALALFLPLITDSYQVFVNGRLIGKVGGMPPEQKVLLASYTLFPIPADLLTPERPFSLAIRVWHGKIVGSTYGEGMIAPPVVGDPHVLSALRTMAIHDEWWSMSETALAFLCNFLTALAGLALFALRRREREYLWFGAAQMLWALQCAIYLNSIFHPVPFYAMEMTIVCAIAGAQLLNLEFFITLMRQRRRLLYWTAAVPLIASVLLIVPMRFGWLPIAQYSFVNSAAQLLYGICVPTLLYQGARGGNFEARILLYPFSFSFGCNIVGGLLGTPSLARMGWVQRFSDRFFHLVTWPFSISAMNLAGILAMFSVVVVLVLRFVRSREDEERLVSELAAARAVQHVLIPDEIPSVPGYRVDCVYKPAGQVGGDFFQILPLADGGALVAIGDVSGKGMPAAMTVSLLVGTLRAMAESTTSPASLLASMNRLLMGRTPGGFATCLILHVSSYGWLTASNAGHIPPYVGALEMAIDNGLPLGIDAGAAYTESSLQLGPAQPVTLMTDGVAEARNADGELFGFDRTAGIAGRSVGDIAAAAQAFGQSDDITVLRLTRHPVEDECLALLGQTQWADAKAS